MRALVLDIGANNGDDEVSLESDPPDTAVSAFPRSRAHLEQGGR